LRGLFEKITLYIFLLLGYVPAESQLLNFYTYTKNSGLLNNEVRCILQASNRSMYFGTPLGLSVYDGASFNNFDIKKGFRHNIISDIVEGKDREISLFTNSDHYYRLFRQRLAIDSIPEQIAIKKLYRGRSGRQYACTYSGLYLFHDGKIQKLPVAEGKAYPRINCVVEWQDSLLVVGRSYEPLDIYNMHTWRRVASSAGKFFVRDLCVDASGNLWAATIGSGVCLLRRGEVKNAFPFSQLPPGLNAFRQAEFRAIVQDRAQNIWMASINQGLIEYNPASGEFHHITMQQGLASNTLFSLCCDGDDNIWIGTNQGLQKLVHHYSMAYTSRQGLPADLVLDAMPLPSGEIITCGYSGVGHINAAGSSARSWRPPLEDEYFSRFTSFNDHCMGLSLRQLVELDVAGDGVQVKRTHALPEHYRSLAAWDAHKLLLGGDSSILLFMDGKLHKFITEKVRYVSCMTVDAQGILWTGSLNNIINGYQIRENGKQLSASLIFQYAAQSAGAQDFIQCISVNKAGDVFYGTAQSGIGLLSVSGNKLIETGRISTAAGLGNNNVLCMQWHDDSTLLAGTGSGIDKILFSTIHPPRVLHINDYYNFSNSVYSIRENEKHHFLLGTEAGLFRLPSVDVESGSMRNMPVAIAALKLISDPDSIIADNNTINLSHDNKGITISYASPNFVNEKNTRFTYLLEGGNQQNWSRPAEANQVSLIDLPPGKYRFMVRAVNIFEEASSDAAIVNISIRPAFWQRWWFYGLIVLATGAILFFAVTKRINNIRRASAVKNKIAVTEMMALRAQMNPHFIFNCMNIIDGLITDNRREEAQDFLQTFSKLIRLVLENSQHQLVPLFQDVHALKLYTSLEAIRYDHEFSYTFEIDNTLLESNYKIPPLLLQPYVENAIVHGLRHKENGHGLVTVCVKKETDHVSIVIEDNGIGRARAMEFDRNNGRAHQPIGLNVTGKRIELLKLTNGDNVSIHITDLHAGEETGTRVVIKFPLEFRFD